MSITTERAAIVAALAAGTYPNPIRFSPHPPTKLAPNLAYVTMTKVEPAGNYGRDLAVTWQITATIAPTASAAEATALLDELTDSLISTIHTTKVADVTKAGEYVGLIENSNGATYPAVQITIESITPAKG